MSWLGKAVRGIFLDITGVLKDGDVAIEGSVEAVKRLQESGIRLRFVTNESQVGRKALWKQLLSLGYNIPESEVFPPAPAAVKILQEECLRPYLLTHPNLAEEFSTLDKREPNCIVIGDAAEYFTYDNLNQAFKLLFEMKPPRLFSLGKGRYYKDGGKLWLDVGAYATALEFACDVKADVIGKPSSLFFQTALNDIGISADEAVMVGDDIVSDVGGAQKCGIRGILVRTGKFLPTDENHSEVKPDAIVDNLAAAVNILLSKEA